MMMIRSPFQELLTGNWGGGGGGIEVTVRGNPRLPRELADFFREVQKRDDMGRQAGREFNQLEKGAGGGVKPKTPPKTPSKATPLYSKVSKQFIEKLNEIAKKLGIPADHLMAIMAFETGESFKANQTNAKSSTVGLIQFTAAGARSIGMSLEELKAMTPEQQLDAVEKYFEKNGVKRGQSLEDTYMIVLSPNAVGKPNDHVVFSKEKNEKIYEANKGLDRNQDGKVTKEEATQPVRDKLGKLGTQSLAIQASGPSAQPLSTVPTGSSKKNLSFPKTASEDEPDMRRSISPALRAKLNQHEDAKSRRGLE